MTRSGRARRAALAAALALAAFAHRAGARPGPDEEGPAPVRRTILVEGEAEEGRVLALPAPALRAPASFDVVARPRIAARDAAGLGDALADTAGASLQTGFGVFDFFSLRGIDSLSGALLLSGGAPEPESTVYPLYNLERVEVLRGPAGFRWGGDALGGAVSLVRKTALAGRSDGRLRLGFGSHETWRGQADVSLGPADAPLAARLNAWWQEGDGHRGQGPRVLAFNPTLTASLGADASVAIDLERLTSDVTPDAGLPVQGPLLAEAARDADFGSARDFSEQDVTRVRVLWQQALGERWKLSDLFYLNRLDWRTDGTLLLGVLPTPVGDLVPRALLSLDDLQHFTGNRFEATLSTPGHDLVLGFELERRSDRFTIDSFLLPPAPLVDPEGSADEPLVPLPGQAMAGDGRSIVAAPFALSHARLETFDLWLGLRFDHLDHEDEVTSTDRTANQASPFLGVVYAPRPELTLYASGGRAFAPPSSRVSGTVDPETGRQVEAGLKTSLLGGRVQGAFAAYHLERRDIAVPGLDGLSRQTGDQRSRGVELSLSGVHASGVEATFSWAYTDSVLTDFREVVALPGLPPSVQDRSGNRAPFAPRHVLRVLAGGRHASGLGAWGGLRWSAEQFIAADNLFAIHGALLADLTLSYLRRGFEARLHLENLTDRDHLTRGFGGTSVIPAPGRTAHFSLHIPLWGNPEAL